MVILYFYFFPYICICVNILAILTSTIYSPLIINRNIIERQRTCNDKKKRNSSWNWTNTTDAIVTWVTNRSMRRKNINYAYYMIYIDVPDSTVTCNKIGEPSVQKRVTIIWFKVGRLHRWRSSFIDYFGFFSHFYYFILLERWRYT